MYIFMKENIFDFRFHSCRLKLALKKQLDSNVRTVDLDVCLSDAEMDILDEQLSKHGLCSYFPEGEYFMQTR